MIKRHETGGQRQKDIAGGDREKAKHCRVPRGEKKRLATAKEEKRGTARGGKRAVQVGGTEEKKTNSSSDTDPTTSKLKRGKPTQSKPLHFSAGSKRGKPN